MEKKEEIMRKLINEEKIEEDLISLYSTLLESGIFNCLDSNIIDSVYKNLTVLKEESVIHRQVVAEIIKRHQKI